jgi:hypothetical protein
MSDFDFDVNAFMATEYDAATSTKRLTLADGAEYTATITEVKTEPIVKKDGSGKIWKMVIGLKFEGAEIERLTKRTPFTDKADFILDLTMRNGMAVLDMSEGMNTGLGVFRSAIGLNKSGENWSPLRSIGRPVRVKHKLQPDANDPTKIYSRYQFLPQL